MKSKIDGLTASSILVTAFVCCVCLLAYAVPVSADTQWDVGISGGEKGIEGFHLSVGNYYDVPEREVVVVHERGIHDEELPVVFYLSKRAHVRPEAVVDLRLRGMSWMDITLHFGLHPDIYYVPVTVIKEYHSPHGHAWGYYKKHPRHEDWRRIQLRDAEIVDQVNLKFISDHYKYSPERVMKYRAEGRNFPGIDRDVKNEKHGKAGHDKAQKSKAKYSGEKNKKSSQKDYSNKKGNGGNDKHDDYWKENKHEGKGKK